MGYYSTFQVADTDIENILGVLRANSGNYGDGWYDGGDYGIYMSDAKWYDWENDLRQIAYQYPNNFLIIVRYGEESPDMERAIVRNGKLTLQRPNISWPAE